MPTHTQRPDQTQNTTTDSSTAAGGGGAQSTPQPPASPGGGALTNPLFSGDHVLETVSKGGGLLRPGARGPAVRAVQQFLINEGYDLGRWGADGAWGKVTTKAVKDWQKKNHLGDDGIIGKNTLGAMDVSGGGGGNVTPAPEPTPTPEPTPEPEPTTPDDTQTDTPNGDVTPAEIAIPSGVSNLNLREFAGALDPVLAGASVAPNSARQTHVYGLQRALSALGYPTNGIDGKYGGGTKGAVEKLQKEKNLLGPGEAVGTTYARTLAYLDLNAPMHAQVLSKTKINYDKLYADKLVEFGLFVGYDEGIGGHWYQDVRYAHDELGALGFTEDKDAAAAAYSEAGRALPDGPGEFWVHESYTEHLGNNIKAVFRLVHSDMGPDVADEYRESLMQGEVTMYSGHGRYGSGPDFDRNYTITVEGERMSYDEAKHYVAKKTGKPHPSNAEKAAMLKKLSAQGLVKVEGENSGNVVMNDTDVQNTFGSAVMYLALQNSSGTGENKNKRLTADYAQEADDNYKVWMFDGCSTKNYMGSIRRDVSKDQVAVMGTGTSITMCTSMELVRGMMTQATGAQIAKNMSASHNERHADGARGGGQHFIDG
ncbi:MAG: peptidoglycan-binding protein [Myxococcales bacterium]|nr:peptidoglycan-binding protein [Myxococcales bacterium]